MNKFIDILASLAPLETRGDTGINIKAIRFDSRTVRAGDLFVAVRGAQADGHNFIEKAIENGAAAIVWDSENPGVLAEPKNVVFVKVEDSAEALGIMAANFFGNPSRSLQLVGVTGTNGKTTTVTLLYQLFMKLGFKTGMLGTVENRIGEALVPATHTTPDPVVLNQLLAEMVAAGCSHCFMEVSSHAVEQRRIAGLQFVGGVFSNLTHDHLDYHKTFADYRDAKKRFFDDLPRTAFALVNNDDKNGRFMLQNTKAAHRTYGLKKPSDYKTKILENTLDGLQLRVDEMDFHARMIGEFNAYNLTAAYATACELGISKMETLTALSDLRGAEGRFDYVTHTRKGCIGIVDYAHTPDALEKVLDTIRNLKKPAARIITVAGAGGDRDKTKRPVMAQICARRSDQLILTSDNPRTENPAQILAEMEAGLSPEDLKKTLTIENREQAIKTACRLAAPGDVILVAGKGHEKYQDINGVKHSFDDKAMIVKYFGE